jgi:hypothetical protein
MAKVIITESLKNEIFDKFKKESKKIFKLIHSLKDNPKKGKIVGQVSGIIIKEIKYEKFRFYFIANGFQIKALNLKDLQNLVIKFIRMSDKKTQNKVIEEIKSVLRKLGEDGF